MQKLFQQFLVPVLFGTILGLLVVIVYQRRTINGLLEQIKDARDEVFERERKI